MTNKFKFVFWVFQVQILT